MNWKEKVITKLVLSESKDEFLQFIEAEIIEKIIEEIPNYLEMQVGTYFGEPIKNGKELKKHLRAKWLKGT